MHGEPGDAPIRTKRLELVALSAAFLGAVLDGRRDAAEAEAAIAIPEGWPDEHDERFLRRRAGQLWKDAAWQEWLVRAVTLRAPGRPMIGHAGFHGPPGVNGLRNPDALEVGYTIFEDHRGRGYATEAARALIDWAHEQRGIRHFIASVAPDNAPSLALVKRLGFVQTGEVWDDEDGRELVFELEA